MAKKKRSEDGKPSRSGSEQVDFETTLAEVQNVVQELESGELGLTESLEHYERGIAKIKLCHELLARAEKRIAVLTSVDQDGTANVELVDTDGQTGESGETSSVKKTVRKKPRPPVSDVDDSAGLF